MNKPAAAVNARMVSLVAPGSPEAEHYRRLRHVVEQVRGAGEGTVIAVCSPAGGDGKTLTAINLAGALSQNPLARVLLGEFDLRRPSFALAEYLALGGQAGVGVVDAVLDPGLELEDVARRLPGFNLSVLPAGRPATTPYEVLKSPHLGRLLAEARRRYHYVILDTPPVVPVPDCRLIAGWVDGFLMVAAADRTRRAMLAEALNLMDPDRLIGIVFNRCDPLTLRQYGYDYAYGNVRSPGRGWLSRWLRL